MKKIKLNPLKLDKKVVADLDKEQLKKVLGGVRNFVTAPGTTCQGGNSQPCNTSCN